jgi:hypothetical protein
MVEAINAMMESMNDPPTRHAALVHLPVALSLVCVLLALLAAVAAPRVPAFRGVALGGFLLLAVSAWVATESGEEAHHAWDREYSAVAHELLEQHEEMAERVAWAAVAIAVLVVVSAIRKPMVRHGAAGLALLGSVGLAGWVAYTGHLGGTMVYAHGVGIATPAAKPVNTDALATDDPRAVFFVEQVRPLLEEHCMRCHNPAKARRAGGLDQTSIAAMLQGGRSGPALVPGRPDESLVIKAVRYDEELELEMPPDDDKLSDPDIAVLEQWVRDGAVWADPRPEPAGESPGPE